MTTEKKNLKIGAMESGETALDWSDGTEATGYMRHDLAECLMRSWNNPAKAITPFPAEWEKHVNDMWQCIRKHNGSIPSEVLDEMRRVLLDATPNKEAQ